MDKQTLLIVDGQADKHPDLISACQALGLNPVFRSTVKEAKKLCSRQAIQLALIDYQLAMAEPNLVHLLKSDLSSVLVIALFQGDEIPPLPQLNQQGFESYLCLSSGASLIQSLLQQAMLMIQTRQENQKLSRELLRSEEYYQALLNATHEAIVVVDQNFAINYCNRAFQQFMSIDIELLKHQNMQHYLEDGFKVLHYIYQQLTLGKKVEGYRVTLKTEQDARIDVNLGADFHYTPTGYIEGLVLIMENRLLQDRFFKGLLRKERLTTIQQLSSALAHEIQNPTNILSGRIQLLQKELQSEEHQKNFETIERQIQRIGEILEQLQKFNNSREDSIPEEFALIDFLEELIARRKETSKINFSLHYQEKERDLLIQASRLHIEDAFTYLFRVLEGLLPEQYNLDIHCRLFRTFAHMPSLELTMEFDNAGLPEDLFEPFNSVNANEAVSLLDLALVHTIFSNYDIQLHLENLFAEKKVLKLQFNVVGVKNIGNGNTEN